MTNTHCRKAYVSVNLDVDEEGVCGIRYTVMIRGRESYLFQEGTKWFVEAKEGAR